MTEYIYRVLCEKKIVTTFNSFEKAQEFVRENEKNEIV